MIVEKISIENFKNISGAELEFHPQYNLITGKNAQGKTNLLESIWIFTGCRSFRGSKERDFVSFGKERCDIKLKFADKRRSQNAEYILLKSGLSKEKKIMLNKVDIASSKELFERFKCVVFTPDDISLVSGAPEKRRNFVDLCISQINPSAMSVLRKTENLIIQRNAVLKNIFSGKASVSDLDIWDMQLCRVGSWMSFYRHKYVEELSLICGKFYGEITGGKEKLTCEYNSNVFSPKYKYPEKEPDKTMAEAYYKALVLSRDEDIKTGRTRCGAGRDDIIFKIDGNRVRDFGSQGQKKSTALVLKLSQANIFREKLKESPVILLDDVMGELDANRQKFIYSIIKDMQVFITTCHSESIHTEMKGKIFSAEAGKFTEKN